MRPKNNSGMPVYEGNAVGDRDQPFFVLHAKQLGSRLRVICVVAKIVNVCSKPIFGRLRRIASTAASAEQLAMPCGPLQRRTRGPDRLEAQPVVMRCHPNLAEEGAPHRLFRAKTAAPGDALDTELSSRQHLASRLHTQPLDGTRRRQPNKLTVASRERPRAHTGTLRKRLNREVVREVARHPAVQPVKDSSRVCSSKVSLNCAWPPGRLRYTTR